MKGLHPFSRSMVYISPLSFKTEFPGNLLAWTNFICSRSYQYRFQLLNSTAYGFADGLIDWLYDIKCRFPQYFSYIAAASWPIHALLEFFLTSYPRNILSKSPAAFSQNHFRNNGQRWERNESCRNGYHQCSGRIYLYIIWKQRVPSKIKMYKLAGWSW